MDWGTLGWWGFCFVVRLPHSSPLRFSLDPLRSPPATPLWDGDNVNEIDSVGIGFLKFAESCEHKGTR